MRFGDAVTVEICRAHVSESEATLGYRIARAEGGEVCVVGQVVHTFVDRASFKRMPIPAPVRRALEHIEAGSG
jgi:acyl-CoA thioesterase FadM